MVKALKDMWFDPSGYYVVALSTLLLCILIALYFANFLKDDVELEDEGLGADELNLDDDPELKAQIQARLLDIDIDDDEAYEEEHEPLSDSDTEATPARALNYSNLVGKFKAKQYQHKLAKNLSAVQLEEERRIEREQLTAIFELLRRQEDELNLKERISDNELKQQVKLYR